MSDAEKVVKVFREHQWDRIPERALPLLADFVEAATRVRNPPQTCGARDHSCANCAIDKQAQDAALARLREVLS